MFLIYSIFLISCIIFNPVQSDARFRAQNKNEVINFDGYQVLRVIVEKTEQVEALLGLQEGLSEYDFWVEPRIGFCDIMSPRGELKNLENFLTTNGMTYTVLIEDVGLLVKKEKEINTKEYKNITKGEINWTAYHRYSDITSWMDNIASQYKNGIAKTIIIGKSSENRDIKLMKISTGGSGKSAIFIDGTFHAREFISPALCTYVISQLVTQSTKYKSILDSHDVYVLPIVNPDGYEHAHSNDRMWRKTRSVQKGSDCLGVDPNRNFGHEWGGSGSSSDGCSEIYRGQTAFSEPETQALRNFITNSASSGVKWRAYLTVHSYGQYFLTPWGYTSAVPEDYDELVRVAKLCTTKLASRYGTKYTVGSSTNVLYAAAGGSDDWAKGSGHFKYSYTIELRDNGRHGFVLPQRQITPTCLETMDALEVLMAQV